ncbi:MAG: hypothetical protein AABW54_03770, partial [Candidatus Micrarchaeota archaeon]
MLRVLVVYPDKDPLTKRLAQAVFSGAASTGSEAHLLSASQFQGAEYYDLFLIGTGAFTFGADRKVSEIVSSGKLSGKRAAFFCVHSGRGKLVLEQLLSLLEASGGHGISTLSIPLSGLLKHFAKGALTDVDLARGQAFGERTCNNALGVRVVKHN